jgi:hypothetical protein
VRKVPGSSRSGSSLSGSSLSGSPRRSSLGRASSWRAARLVAALAGAATFGALSCGDDAPGGPAPAFPSAYAASYTEVRGCRSSGEHELNNIRVLADPDALVPYRDRLADFPVGSVVLKEEYDFGDTSCGGEVIRWTVMARLAPGSSAQTLDWYWQDVDGSRRVVSENDSRCIGCHQGCGAAPEGYEGTCTVVGATGGAFP